MISIIIPSLKMRFGNGLGLCERSLDIPTLLVSIERPQVCREAHTQGSRSNGEHREDCFCKPCTENLFLETFVRHGRKNGLNFFY